MRSESPSLPPGNQYMVIDLNGSVDIRMRLLALGRRRLKLCFHYVRVRGFGIEVSGACFFEARTGTEAGTSEAVESNCQLSRHAQLVLS